MPEFTDHTLERFLAELKRQAALGGHPTYASGLNWNKLEDIAGPRAYRAFTPLLDAGLLREEILPGTYGPITTLDFWGIK